MVELSHERLLRNAEQTGPCTAAVIRQQVHGRVHPEQTLRCSLGILRLAKDFDAARLEAACERALSFEDRLSLLLQHEVHDRNAQRLGQRLRWAKLPQSACIEDLDTRTPRGLQKMALAQVTDLVWIREHLNVLLCGPTGVGKFWIACAIGHAACRADYAVRFYRLPRLIDELTRATAMNNRSSFFRSLARIDLLVLDDFGLAPLTEQTRRDLLEILGDRYDKKSTLITSQLPVEQWHVYLGDPTLADAILDRLVHNSYRLNLSGDSMRKRRTAKPAAPPSIWPLPLPDPEYLRPATHWPDMRRNAGPACRGIVCRHRRITQSRSRSPPHHSHCNSTHG